MRPLAPALLLVSACTGGGADTATGNDTASPQKPWFDAGILDPAFEHVNASWAGVALLDFDGDGWLDIFLPNGKNAPDGLYRNNGDGSFTDVAADAGVASMDENGPVLSADLDNDGDPDLLVATVCTTGTWGDDGNNLYDGGKLLYLNRGDGSFAQTDLGLPESWAYLEQTCTVSMTAVDVDEDGFLDVVLANGHDLDVTPPWIFDKRDPGAANAVLFNDGTGHFDDAWIVNSPITSFVHAVADLDGDGHVELYQGEGGDTISVIDAGAAGPTERLQATTSGKGLWMGLALADYDRDGDLDLYATNQGLSPYLRGYDNTLDYYPGSVSILVDPDSGERVEVHEAVTPFHALLENEGGHIGGPASWSLHADHFLAGDGFQGLNGRYLEWVPPHDLERLPWGWGAAALDVDSDGWMDVAWTGNNGTAPMDIIDDEDHAAGPGGLFINDHDHGFVDHTWDAGVANVDAEGRYQDGRGIAVGDLNRDGFADYVVANRTTNPSLSGPLEQRPGQPMVWLSHPRTGHWLVIDPVGTTSNRDAVGGLITVHHGDDSLVLPVGSGGTTCSSSARQVMVGLGDWTEVDVDLRFPSGRVATLTGIAADQVLTVEEP